MLPVQTAFEALATHVRFEHGDSIYQSASSEDFCYRVLSGAVRKCAVTSGGHRRIVDFLLPHDLFGLGEDRRHRFALEASVNDTTIARYPRSFIERLADSDPRVARQIREAACASIDRLEGRMLILGLGRARERVCAFLLDLAGRLDHRRSEAEICLPMSRYDIADYLAMAVETVSRVLTQLRLEGVIYLSSQRSVRICDWDALQWNCAATRSVSPRLRASGSCIAASRGTMAYSA